MEIGRSVRSDHSFKKVPESYFLRDFFSLSIKFSDFMQGVLEKFSKSARILIVLRETTRGYSSVGRASRLQREGHRFESDYLHLKKQRSRFGISAFFVFLHSEWSLTAFRSGDLHLDRVYVQRIKHGSPVWPLCLVIFQILHRPSAAVLPVFHPLPVPQPYA